MQRAELLPGIALILAIALTVGVTWPVWLAYDYLLPAESVRWYAAAYDYRPHIPAEDVPIATLRAPSIVATDHAREYEHAFPRRGAQPAVMLPVLPKRSRIYINGLEVEASTIRSKGQAVLAPFPEHGFQAGLNRVQVVAADAAPYEWPRLLFFGPADVIGKAGQRLDDIRAHGARIVSLVASTAAVLGFALALLWRTRRYLALPSAFALLLALGPQLTLAGLANLSPYFQTWLSLLCLAAAAYLLFVIVASESQSWTYVNVAIFRAGAATLAAIISAPLAALGDAEFAQRLAHSCAISMAIIGGGAAIWAAIGGSSWLKDWASGVRAVAALAGLSLIGASMALSEAPGPTASMLGGPLFVSAAGLGSLGWLGWILTRLFLDLEAVAKTRLGMNRLVLAQQAKLAAQQQEIEREISRRAALEERSRLSREIHDGIGGALVSLLTQVRSGGIAKDDLESNLTQTLSDLRLMIDAVDHTGEPLPAAFSTFYTRISPVLESVGLSLIWRIENLDELRLADPSHLLNVFRILQEAITNVIRHSSASQVSITVTWNEQRQMLCLDVLDDGQVAVDAGPVGYGLRNMAKRAADIRAEFSAGPDRDAGGWRVRLGVPCIKL